MIERDSQIDEFTSLFSKVQIQSWTAYYNPWKWLQSSVRLRNSISRWPSFRDKLDS